MLNNKGQESFVKRFIKKGPDERGQAFSVFELMIAAIVAVAILFVLLPILGGLDTGATGGPRDAVSNSLSAVRTGGNQISTAFNLENGDSISSLDFIRDGFDQRSIHFGYHVNLDRMGDVFEVGELGEGGQIITYSGTTRLPARARVICQLTENLLEQALTAGRILNNYVEYGQRCEEAQPCCLVLIERSN